MSTLLFREIYWCFEDEDEVCIVFLLYYYVFGSKFSRYHPDLSTSSQEQTVGDKKVRIFQCLRDRSLYCRVPFSCVKGRKKFRFTQVHWLKTVCPTFFYTTTQEFLFPVREGRGFGSSWSTLQLFPLVVS